MSEEREMTKDQALEALRKMREEPSDPERAHGEAETILCAVLRNLGHGDLAEAFEQTRDHVGFWYA